MNDRVINDDFQFPLYIPRSIKYTGFPWYRTKHEILTLRKSIKNFINNFNYNLEYYPKYYWKYRYLEVQIGHHYVGKTLADVFFLSDHNNNMEFISNSIDYLNMLKLAIKRELSIYRSNYD